MYKSGQIASKIEIMSIVVLFTHVLVRFVFFFFAGKLCTKDHSRDALFSVGKRGRMGAAVLPAPAVLA